MNTTGLLRKLLTIVVIPVVLSASLPEYAAEIMQADLNSGSDTMRNRARQERANLEDLTATLVVDYRNDQVLEKIGEGRVSEYGIKQAQVRLKAPDCSRIEGTAHRLRVVSITNHDYSILRIKPLGYQKTKPLDENARYRPFSMLLGLVTPEIWDRFAVNDVGILSEGTDEFHVFDLLRTDSSRKLYRITIDTKTLTLRECDTYRSEGDTPRLTCRYLEPMQVNGLWVPTKVEMRSADNELAVVFKLNEITVNTSLDDALFH